MVAPLKNPIKLVARVKLGQKLIDLFLKRKLVKTTSFFILFLKTKRIHDPCLALGQLLSQVLKI
jgi:hypothetical protein